jgi:hypothetical protein
MAGRSHSGAFLTFGIIQPLREETMKIKDHPKIKYGSRSWTGPPVQSYSGSARPAEIGACTLKEAVYYPKLNGTPGHIAITTDCQGQRLTAQYRIDDEKFGEKLCQKLNADCIGKTMREIGGIEIDL